MLIIMAKSGIVFTAQHTLNTWTRITKASYLISDICFCWVEQPHDERLDFYSNTLLIYYYWLLVWCSLNLWIHISHPKWSQSSSSCGSQFDIMGPRRHPTDQLFFANSMLQTGCSHTEVSTDLECHRKAQKWTLFHYILHQWALRSPVSACDWYPAKPADESHSTTGRSKGRWKDHSKPFTSVRCKVDNLQRCLTTPLGMGVMYKSLLVPSEGPREICLKLNMIV